MPLPADLAEVFESLRDPADAALNPGFYQRVNHKIQISRHTSILSFAQGSAGSHVALVFAALILLIIGVAVVQEPKEFDEELDANHSYETVVTVADSPGQQRDAVLANIAAYSRRGQ